MSHEKLRIAIVQHSFRKGDGQARVNYEILLEVLRQGYDTTLISSFVDDKILDHKNVRWIPIPVSKWPTELLKNAVFGHGSGKWLMRHRHEFDIIHVNGSITSVPGDVNTSHFVHSAWLHSPAHIFKLRKDAYGYYQYLYTLLNSKLERRAYLSARVVVAVSEQVKNELIEIGVPSERIVVILNGVDLREFRPGFADRQKLGLPVGVPLGLFAGDIRTTRKNLDTVIKALVDAPNVHLAVAGRVLDSPFPELAVQSGVADRVHFLDFRRDIPDLMRSCDFFVFPSRYEACSLVLLEAMASGLPVITSKAAGGSEIISSDAGFVMDNPNDTSVLSSHLNTLGSDVERRKRMGITARLITENYSWETMAVAYCDLYRSLQLTSQTPEKIFI